MGQGSQTALADGRGRLGERLARWLLMWQDRIREDGLVVTPEFLSILLGARRSAVTVALQLLKSRSLIEATRTLIRVTDRKRLQAAANGSYGIPEAEYDRLMGPLAATDGGPSVLLAAVFTATGAAPDAA